MLHDTLLEGYHPKPYWSVEGSKTIAFLRKPLGMKSISNIFTTQREDVECKRELRLRYIGCLEMRLLGHSDVEVQGLATMLF